MKSGSAAQAPVFRYESTDGMPDSTPDADGANGQGASWFVVLFLATLPSGEGRVGGCLRAVFFLTEHLLGAFLMRLLLWSAGVVLAGGTVEVMIVPRVGRGPGGGRPQGQSSPPSQDAAPATAMTDLDPEVKANVMKYYNKYIVPNRRWVLAHASWMRGRSDPQDMFQATTVSALEALQSGHCDLETFRTRIRFTHLRQLEAWRHTARTERQFREGEEVNLVSDASSPYDLIEEREDKRERARQAACLPSLLLDIASTSPRHTDRLVSLALLLGLMLGFGATPGLLAAMRGIHPSNASRQLRAVYQLMATALQ